ncbi:MAG: hypothetical protein E7222_13180 [Clostridiales bacterium]|nr:hypothetical protein [Clostridiales bacterium]
MANRITKHDADHYLYEIAKEYKKANRANPYAELIIVGGGAIMLGYNFRSSTEDFDVIIRGSSSLIKEIANRIGDKNDLANGWLNSDFSKTTSYSKELILHSKFYKTFCNCLDVRIVPDEYLIAMKLVSGREYKHDCSDIIGILSEAIQKKEPLSFDKIDRAVNELYGGWGLVSDDMKNFLNNVLKETDLEGLYYRIEEKETVNRERLKQILKENPELNKQVDIAFSYLENFDDDFASEKHNDEQIPEIYHRGRGR